MNAPTDLLLSDLNGWAERAVHRLVRRALHQLKPRPPLTYGEWAERTRRLGGVLDALGISADGRVGTFAWNSARHLELYFAAPCTGRVLHTLNIRLFPEQLTYIVNHAAHAAELEWGQDRHILGQTLARIENGK